MYIANLNKNTINYKLQIIQMQLPLSLPTCIKHRSTLQFTIY